MKKLIVVASMAVIAASTLAGCSAAQVDATGTPTPRPTVTSTPNPDYTAPTGACVDGVATITADVTDIALPEGCATVNVLTNGSTIELGPVETLQIEGNDNTVTAASASSITVFGTGNALTHGGDPKVTDEGERNTVNKR